MAEMKKFEDALSELEGMDQCFTLYALPLAMFDNPHDNQKRNGWI